MGQVVTDVVDIRSPVVLQAHNRTSGLVRTDVDRIPLRWVAARAKLSVDLTRLPRGETE